MDAITLGFLGVWLLLLFVGLPYWQNRRQRRLLTQLKVGDRVIVVNGILGKVLKVDGGTVEVEIGPKMRITCLPNAIRVARE